MRLVGRDEDGAAILLGKAYFKLGIFEGFYTTAVYFALTSLDSKLNPEFAKGDALPPLVADLMHFSKLPTLINA